VHDRCGNGARLRLARDALLPPLLLLYDDERDDLAIVAVVWRRGQEVGVRFTGDLPDGDLAPLRRRLGGKYYAL
jgi:hypothetical protein